MTDAFVPAEWALQKAVWLTWPSMSAWWGGGSPRVFEAFAALVAAVSHFEKVRVNCPVKAQEAALKYINAAKVDLKNLEFFDNDSNDVWCRDSGAVFRLNAGALEALDFKYNSWGGKFPPWDKDDLLASKMAVCAGAKNVRIADMTCEGGGLEFDGRGLLMTTECVVLNKNRNPDLSKGAADEIFKKYCGVRRVIWLPDGLYNDDTDGHIDNLARFTPCGKILAAFSESDNPSYASLKTNYDILKETPDSAGKPFDVIKLNVPLAPVRHLKTGAILPASYANYLVINGAVIVPSYAQESSDDAAAGLIGEFFCGRRVIKLDSRAFLEEGGAVHCLTQQEPLAQK